MAKKEQEDKSSSTPKRGRSKSKSKKSTREIGCRGENAAVNYLKRMGYDIIDRNWKCPAGEVDIIARDGECLVFCEVKTRTDIEHGLPEEKVNASKRKRYEKIACWYLSDHDFVDIPVRFDIIGLMVVGEKNKRAFVRHLVNAFTVMA